jgi:preprotein translocase subunit SecA
MLGNLRTTVSQVLSNLEIRMQEEPPPPPPEPAPLPARARALAMAGGGGEIAELDLSDPAVLRQVPRNAPCPCGSGRKFKQCHGRLV